MVRSKVYKELRSIYPTYNDAVENETYFKSHVLLQTTVQMGMGYFTLPISMAALSRQREFPAHRKFAL